MWYRFFYEKVISMYEKACRFFEEFTSQYQIEDDFYEVFTYSRKYIHSKTVVEYMNHLVKGKFQKDHDIQLAKTIAIFHDLGRFTQLEKYHSYNDTITHFDHAKESIRILKEANWFRKNQISKEEESILCCAIYFHNKWQIPSSVQEPWMTYSKLIRDADKLAILSVKEKQPIEKSPISEKVWQSFQNNELVQNKDKKTPTDFIIGTLSFLYDIHYEKSKKLIQEEKMMENWLQRVEGKIPPKQMEEIQKIIKEALEKRKENVR